MVVQRLSRMKASGIAVHKNHGPPLAPLISQITNMPRVTASQNCHTGGRPTPGA